jgi:uncharacterized protein YcbX
VIVGTVRELGRFPVKSMLGESPASVDIGEVGVEGDRRYGLVDVDTGKVASAKDPRRWAELLHCRAEYDGETLVFTMADGVQVRSDAPDVDAVLSASLGRSVRLCDEVPDPTYDYVWEIDGLAPDEVIQGSQTSTTAEGRPVSTMPLAFMAPGTFQDVAPITLMTTAALRKMASHHPEGDWDPARFRSNLLLETEGDEVVENAWAGQRLAVGDVVLEVTSPAPRCVMTTLAQPGIERDRGILRAVASHNRQEFAGLGIWACLGAYATVVTPGRVSVGDEVRLLD